jgi:hypothetical protein
LAGKFIGVPLPPPPQGCHIGFIPKNFEGKCEGNGRSLPYIDIRHPLAQHGGKLPTPIYSRNFYLKLEVFIFCFEYRLSDLSKVFSLKCLYLEP